MAPRTPLAMRDCRRLKPVSRRPTRWPATRPTRPVPFSSSRSSAGMKAGSFCPSPSRVATRGARAAATPVRTAADWPHDAACLTWRSHGFSRASRTSVASVSSVEPSFTKITSKVQWPASGAAISSARGPTLAASLRTGTTTDTAGASVALSRKLASLILPSVQTYGGHRTATRYNMVERRMVVAASRWFSAGPCRFLLTGDATGNLFDALQRRPRQPQDVPVRPQRKGQAPGCEPAAHQQRAASARDRAGNHVAWVVRGDDDAGERNDAGIDPQRRACARKQGAERHGGRKRRRAVAGRQAGKLDAPRQRREIDVVALDAQRPRAADQPLG